MSVPFTVEQFFDVFESYNVTIWPAQVVAYALGLAAVLLAVRDIAVCSRIATGILALFWLWMGVVYHILFFRRINPAAGVFGAFFVAQGLVLLLVGCMLAKLRFRFAARPVSVVGAAFILYALAIYPILGRLFGHVYPRCPVFGVAPCPATIFTFGLFLWASRPVPLYTVLIPFLWSLVGLSAAISLHVPQDYGLGLAGILGAMLVIVNNRKLRKIT